MLPVTNDAGGDVFSHKGQPRQNQILLVTARWNCVSSWMRFGRMAGRLTTSSHDHGGSHNTNCQPLQPPQHFTQKIPLVVGNCDKISSKLVFMTTLTSGSRSSRRSQKLHVEGIGRASGREKGNTREQPGSNHGEANPSRPCFVRLPGTVFPPILVDLFLVCAAYFQHITRFPRRVLPGHLSLSATSPASPAALYCPVSRV